MKTDIYDIKGQKAGDIELSSVFEAEVNNDLIHQVAVSMMSNKRMNTAHSKDRSEVRGGGKNLENKKEQVELDMVLIDPQFELVVELLSDQETKETTTKKLTKK